ncbi:uncharacterized protein LOC124201971 isoform X2 [Daphnia pulex]|nr:uncharacterized protein LOC124201971 isoform X2 [Daphnia pulex]
MNIPVNIFRTLERPVLNLIRQSSTAKKVLENPAKDDPTQHHFSLKQKAETIHHVLGWKISRAKHFLKKDRILSQMPLSHYTKICEIVKPFTPISGEILEGTSLLLASPPVVQRNCQFLQEVGVTKATADIIARCQNFTEMSIGIFKCYAHVDPTVDIKAQWLDLLSEPLLLEKTNLLLEQKSNACSSISHVRNVIFASYVAHKWNMPFPQVLKWVEKGIKSLPFSISRLMQILDVLTDIGFSQEQILSHPTLLRSDPNSLELFMSTYKDEFLGENAGKFLQEFPDVTCQIDFTSLHTNVHNLRKFGVPVNCIRNNINNLLVHDPMVLEKKLRQMEPYPELGVFVHHQKFGKLFNDVDTVVLRVETFRAIDKRQITFTACTCSPKDFSAIIQQRAHQRLSEEAVGFLANHTGYDKDQVREILRSHPQSIQLSSENMKKVMELLVTRGFSKLQIFNG